MSAGEPSEESEMIREAVAAATETEKPLREALEDVREADLDTLRRSGLDP